MKDTATKKVGRPKKVIATEPIVRHEWNSEDEVGVFLASLIKMSKYITVLEIGVFEGATSQHLINALPLGGQYVGIDIKDYRTQETKNVMLEGGKSIDFILGSSHDELRKLPKKHFDLIFVDGEHSWSTILPEFKLLETIVSHNGILVYHDTIHFEDPKKLVKYASHYGYNTTTLNTPEVRGLSIIHK